MEKLFNIQVGNVCNTKQIEVHEVNQKQRQTFIRVNIFIDTQDIKRFRTQKVSGNKKMASKNLKNKQTNDF